MNHPSPEAPSLKPDFIGGHFRSLRKDPTGFLTNLSRLGDVTTFRMGKQRGFLINHPDLIRDLLLTSHHKFIKGVALQRMKRLLGEGLLTSEGQFHLRQRRMIQPAFHREKIDGYARSMVDFAERMSSGWRDGEVVDVSQEMMRLTLWIVAKTLFSADVEDDADEIGRSMTDLVELFDYLLLPFSDLLMTLPFPHTMRFKKARRTLDRIIFGIIEERRTSGAHKEDLLSMLLMAQDADDGKGMDDEQLRDECLTLFLAGHETTANALTWTIYLLSQHPDVADKMSAEIDSVIGGGAVSPSHFPQLKYTAWVVAESMRLFPPAWTIGRLAVEGHEFGGFAVQPGALVLASQYILHHDPRFWENPERFDPDRWSQRSVKEAGQAFVYFPFSRGSRNCIGEGFAWMEAVLLLTVLCRDWNFTKAADQRIGLQPLVTLRPRYGMRMHLSRR